jgi:hypothetical protein
MRGMFTAMQMWWGVGERRGRRRVLKKPPCVIIVLEKADQGVLASRSAPSVVAVREIFIVLIKISPIQSASTGV